MQPSVQRRADSPKGETPPQEDAEPTRENIRWPDYVPMLIALSSVLVATLLIVHTYAVFDQTSDENCHIACGMEWLDRGTYHFEALHPPLARIATAIFPYLSGVRDPDINDMVQNGNAILEWGGQYERNLTLARLGILPFFWLACFLVWRFMSLQWSRWHAAIAVFLLALSPVVLAHSALATTDAPLMTMFLWSVLAFWTLLQEPKWFTAARAGLIIGLAVLTKFTELPFFLLTGGALFVYSWILKRRFPVRWKLIAATLVILSLTVWAGYRFELGPIQNPDTASSQQSLSRMALLNPYQREIMSWPWVPAYHFFRGIKDVLFDAKVGRASYLLGQVYQGGRWNFFPVAILVKTPIAFLLLLAVGITWIVSSKQWKRNPASGLLIAGLLGPLLVGVAGSFNIGLRHVLPIYPFAAMFGALGVVCLWQLKGKPSAVGVARTAVLLLVGWNLAACLYAAPDFLAYFNEAAVANPSGFLVDSDLDWGQDVKRLSHELEGLQVHEVSVMLLGNRDLSKAHLPAFRFLNPGEDPGGWIAISEYWMKECPGYSWLDSSPYTRVGKSIRLYHLPPEPVHVAPATDTFGSCP